MSVTAKDIKHQLLDLAEPNHQKFVAALVPNVDNILGVRLPVLRKMAESIAKNDWRTYLQQADNEYFEEVMLQGMVIGYAKADLDEILAYVDAFIPKIANWSVCDSFCSTLKIAKKEPKLVWKFLQPYFQSDDAYAIRFAVVMGLNYFVQEEYLPQLLAHFDAISHDDYYVKMAVAWAISICYIKLPEQMKPYLLENKLDRFTYNKALQKIIESTRIDAETKQQIRDMKRQ